MTTKINKNQINGLNAQLSEITEDIAALSGLGGYINSYDFGTATPTQQALTDYALTQIPNISASEIFNGTKVKNLFDNHLWILTNTPDTDPAVFEWADNGFDTVGIATESTAGVVKASSASGGILVAADGTASVNGFNDKYDKTGGVLSGDISIEKASADTSRINLKNGTVNSSLSANLSGIFLYRTYNNRLVYDNSANKWYVYKLGVAKELGLTDASELSYSGTDISAITIKGALDSLGKRYFGEIYTADNTTAGSVPSGTTYTKSTAFNTAGESRGITVDTANSRLVFPTTGYYKIEVTASSKSGTADVVLRTALFLNDAEVDKIHAIRKIATANDETSTSFGGIIKITSANSYVDVRVRHDSAGTVNLTTQYANLNALYIGDL